MKYSHLYFLVNLILTLTQLCKADPEALVPKFHSQFLPVKENKIQEAQNLNSRFQIKQFQIDRNPNQMKVKISNQHRKPKADKAQILTVKESIIQEDPTLNTEFHAQHFQVDENQIQKKKKILDEHTKPQNDAAKLLSRKESQTEKQPFLYREPKFKPSFFQSEHNPIQSRDKNSNLIVEEHGSDYLEENLTDYIDEIEDAVNLNDKDKDIVDKKHSEKKDSTNDKDESVLPIEKHGLDSVEKNDAAKSESIESLVVGLTRKEIEYLAELVDTEVT